MYKLGDRVLVVDRNEAGTITAIRKYGDIEYYEVMLDSGESTVITIGYIRPYMIIKSPLDLFSQANFQSKEIFVVASAMNKMNSDSTDVIATLKSSRTKFLPYQFKPLLKFFRSENRRILIADEVGLGKTIEAGYILTELSLRKNISNCLIICKSSLKKEWQKELKNKFGYTFEIYKLNELREELQNENGQNVFGILNYDYSNEASNDFLEFVEENEYQFDLLIIDEAHILKNEQTVKHNAAKRLVKLSKSTVLLTATPVMTSITNLYNLVRIIEPKYDEYESEAYNYGYSLFMDHLSLSRPFIEATNCLNLGISPKEVIQKLISEEVDLKVHLKEGGYSYSTTVSIGERFESDPLFQDTVKLALKKPFTNSDFVKLQNHFSELNSFHDIISRTRRKETQTDVNQVVRKAQKLSVQFSSEEMEFYQSIINDYDGEPFTLVLKKREATSCLPAFIQKHKIRTTQAENILADDSKFREFKSILDAIVLKKGKKLIVFSFFRGTLSYLEARLKELKIGTIRIDGDIPSVERSKSLETFEINNSIKVLLSSEVGSEGLNLQFCDAIVNYDLPWNPMVVEQRIGRIDRIGQQSDVIYIYNLCIKDSIEDQIYQRLLDRIQIFTQAIGSIGDILTTDEGLFELSDNLENKIYGHRLNAIAKEKLLRDAELAIENAKVTSKKIEEEFESSFLHDLYVDNEIKNIAKQNRYLTAADLKALLNLLFQTRLNTVRCDLDAEKPYIRVTEDSSLLDFIKDNIDRISAPQLHESYNNFRKRCKGREKIDCTFKQDEAFSNNSLEFISPSHPLIQATLNYFKKQKTANNNAFCFRIASGKVSKLGNAGALFVLAKYRIKTIKKTINQDHESYSELPLLFKLNEDDGQFVLMDEIKTNELSEVDINHWYQNPEPPTSEDCQYLIENLRPILMATIHTTKTNLETEQRNIHLSRHYRLIDTEIDFLSRQIEKDREIINKNPNNAIRHIIAKRINDYSKKIEALKKQKNAVDLKISESLQSLSLIEIN